MIETVTPASSVTAVPPTDVANARRRRSWVVSRRAVGLGAALVAAAVLGVALWLSPEAAGHGTHHQLGLPQCRWIIDYGLPCPTCGMTTAYAHAVRGEMARSFLAQPMGFIMAILTACTLLVGLYVAVTGSAVGTALARLWTPLTMWLTVGTIILAWGYKVLQVKGML